MVLKADQQRVKALLAETITLLCKNGLHFKTKFSIEGLIGITLDEEDIFLVSINETIRAADSVHNDSDDGGTFEQVPHAAKRLRSKNEGVGAKATAASSGAGDSPASPGMKSLNANSSIPKIPTSSQSRFTRLGRQASPHTTATRSTDLVGGPRPADVSINAGVGAVSNLSDSTAEMGNNSLPAAGVGVADGGAVAFPAISIKNDALSDENTYDESKPLCDENDLPEQPTSKRIRLGPSDVRNEPPALTPTSSDASANFAISTETTKSEPPDVIEIKEESISDNESQLQNYSAYGDYNAAMYGSTSADMTTAFADTSMFQGSSSFFVPQTGEGDQTTEGDFVPAEHRCLKCGTVCKSALNLSQHDKFVHRQSFSFVCPICGKGSRGRGDLRGHMATQHNGPRDFKCHMCEKDFAYKHHLMTHLRAVHNL